MTKQELYEKYSNLIYKVIKDINCNWKTEDEWQEYYDAGMLGLIKGINGYDNNQEQTTKYFYNCIRNGITRAFYYHSRYNHKVNYIEKDSLDDIYLDKKTYYEIYPDENVNIEKELIKKEQNEILYKAIDMLKPTYKDIICKYYGIKCKKLTLERIAQNHKISRQAIQIKKNIALQILKRNLIKLGMVE